MNLDLTTEGERPADVLAKAATAGFSVSDRQLTRWHCEGLLPRPTQVWVKGVAGSETIYCSGTGDQLVALCAIRKRFRRTRDVGWMLWWSGFPVAEKFWKEQLERHAARYDRLVPRIVKEIQLSMRDAEDSRHNGLLGRLKEMRIKSILFRQLRKRLGRAHFGTVLFLTIEILQGNFEGFSIAASDDVDLLQEKIATDRALGLFRARSTEQVEQNPDRYEDVGKALTTLSCRIGGTKMMDVLRDASTEQIIEARNEFRALFIFYMRIAERAPEVAKFGLGIKTLLAFARSFEIHIHQMMLVLVLALKEDSRFDQDLKQHVGAIRREGLSRISLDEMELLRRIDPELAGVLQRV